MARYMRQYGKPHLSAPAVVGPGIYYRGIQIYWQQAVKRLADGQQRREPYSRLKPPTVIGAGLVNPGLRIKLVTPEVGRRGARRPDSRLNPPAVIAGAVLFSGPQTTLAPSHAKSRKARPTYIYPAVIPRQNVLGYLAVQNVRRPTRPGRWKLSPPAVLATAQLFFGPSTSLAYSRRGKPTSELRPPVVVGAGVVNPGLRIKLVTPAVGLGNRKQSHYRLQPPTVVTTPAPFLPTLSSSLAPSRTIARKWTSHLYPPTAVDQPEIGVLAAYTTRNSRPDTASSVLRPPAVVNPAAQILPPEIVQLAPQRRGVAKPELRAPAVIGAGVVYPGLRVKLTYPIVGFRNRKKPLFRLEPPTVVAQAPAFLPPETIQLAPQRRGVPKPKLQPPAVVGPGIYYRGLIVRLAPSRRLVAKPRLAPPVTLPAAVLYFGPASSLAYSRRGKAKSFLKPFTSRAFEISLGPTLTLAPSRRLGTQNVTHSRLAPPAILRERGRVEVTLAYSRRGVAKPKLRAPAVVGAGIVFRGLLVHLTYQKGVTPLGRRPKAVYFLSPPIGIIQVPPILDYYDHPQGPMVSSSPDEANFDSDAKGVMSSSPQQDEFSGDPKGKMSNSWRRRADREI